MLIPSVKTIRRILIGVICAVTLAALINYLSFMRRRPRDDGNHPPMISTEFRSAAEGVEINVREGSKLRFTVHASRLRETIQDKNYLEGIAASDFNQDGSVRNSIYSDSAVYDQGRKILDFDGDVRIVLGDGTELRADALYYDLNTEIGKIPGNMLFVSKNVYGLARDAGFFRNEDRLELGGEVVFSLNRDNSDAVHDASEGAIRASAERGTCLLAENRIIFLGGVLLASPDMGALSADAVDIRLDGGRNKIISMTASGRVEYEMRSRDGTGFISGGRMVFSTGDTGALEKALISEQADLLMKTADGDRTLTAGEIEMFMDSETGAIGEIRGINGADFLDRRGAEETRASGEEIIAAFADDGRRIRNVRVSGRSRLVFGGTGNASNELRAETIIARFQEDGESIEILTANSGVRLDFDSSGMNATRTLLASGLEINFAGKYPESGEVSGAATFEEALYAPRMTRRLKAERMWFDFFPGSGQIRSLTAKVGVSAVYERAASSSENSGMEHYETYSDSLEAFFMFVNGTSTLWMAEQSGNFRFVSNGRSASADRGKYNADIGKLTLTGFPEIIDGGGRISGDRIEYDTVAGELIVFGKVRALLDARQGKGNLFQAGFQAGGGSSPVVVSAEELRYRTADASFRFSGDVIAMTESQQVSAREITIDGSGNMDAKDDVRHRIHDAAADAIIESGSMEYLRDKGLIRYSVKVEMKSKELMFSSNVLTATLDDEMEAIRRVLAEGNVLVRHDGRVVRAEAAEWIPAASKFVVTGAPAVIDDPERGRSMARRITYFQDQDRITLEP